MFRLTVVWKVNLIVLAGLSLLLGSSVIFGIVQTGDLGEEKVRLALTGSGVAASLVLDATLVSTVKVEETEDHPYASAEASLKRLAATFGLSDLYVVRPSGDGWEFVFDTADGPFDEEKGREGGFSAYDEPPSELDEAWKGTDTVITAEPYTDEYGTFRSAFLTLQKDGSPVAVVGSDFNLAQLAAARQAQLLLSLVLAVTGLLMIAFLAWVLFRLIDVPLNLVTSRFTALAGGTADLSETVPVRTRDELGELAKGFNGFVEKMRVLVTDLRSGVGETNRIQLVLQRDSEETATTLSQTREGLASLRESGAHLEAAVAEVASRLDDLAAQGSRLDGLARSQGETADRAAEDYAQWDSEAAVLRGHSLDVGRALTELDAESGENVRRMEAEIAVLRQLAKAVEAVNGIVTTLVSTADATSLLAMNASIEAAHAGAQGRGFAVIAQRMRLQGETSRADADRIGETLGRMVELIEQAVSAADETARGADATHARIERAKALMDALKDSSSRLDAFAARGREAMDSLKTASHGVGGASRLVAEGTAAIAGSTQSLRSVSEAVLREAGTLLDGSQHVASVVDDIRDVANRLTTVSRSLEENLQRIRTA